MAATYLTPGVYIEELPSGSMPIQGVGTAVAAFIGFTETYHPDAGDPSDPDGTKPQLVTSWPQYERTFGAFAPGAMLPYAVRGFFDNGGGSAYIVRIAGSSPKGPAALELSAASRADLQSLRLRAVSAGDQKLEVEVLAPAPPAEGAEASDAYTFRVFADGQLREELTGISFGKTVRTVERTINEQSKLLQAEMPQVQGVAIAERAPAPGRYPLAEPTPEASNPQQLEGSETERTGYQGLAIADNVTIVAVPDLITVSTRPDGSLDLDSYLAFQGQLVDWCSAGGTRMAILDPPPRLNAMNAHQWRDRLGKDTAFGTCYYPNVLVPNRTSAADSNGSKFLTVPPSGHIAGVWARTDTARGVWKAPANEELRGIAGLETMITDGEQGELNPIGVNCLRSFGINGIRVWGARTLAQSDQSWRYINVRRLFNFIEESIRRGTQWAVFEPNDRNLWERVKRNINAFLRGLWMQGAMVGATAEQAFYVLCDETNNPPSSVDEGKLIVEIGIAPVKPAEFVIFRISQWQGGGTTNE